MPKRPWILAAALLSLLGLLWLSQHREKPATGDLERTVATLTEASPRLDAQAIPAMNNQRPAKQPPPTQRSDALTPLAHPGAGEVFELQGAMGERVRGLRWSAARPNAPLLLLAPAPDTQARDWQPMVELLRSVRDYHLMAWDAPGLRDQSWSAAGDKREIRDDATRQALLIAIERGASTFFSSSAAIGVIGLDEAGTAAMRLSAARSDLKAVVAISPVETQGSGSIDKALPRLARRQIMAIYAARDERCTPTMRRLSALPHAKRLRVKGKRHGMALLRDDRRVMTDVNGWLFATMGPVR